LSFDDLTQQNQLWFIKTQRLLKYAQKMRKGGEKSMPTDDQSASVRRSDPSILVPFFEIPPQAP
jgi:penicillin-binding protein-related factor A (putative recombinase)